MVSMRNMSRSSEKAIRAILDTIAHRVEEAKLVKNWKNYELAERAGVRTEAVNKRATLASWWPSLRHRIYAGTVPNFRNIVRMAEAFGIDPMELLTPYNDLPQRGQAEVIQLFPKGTASSMARKTGRRRAAR